MTTMQLLAAGASAFTPAEMRPLLPPPISISTDQPTRAWTALIDCLLALRDLKDDWDGQGASAPDPAVVDSALRLASRFRSGGERPADRVLADVNGTVFFEWYTPAHYTEIEVVAPGVVEGRRVNTATNTVEEFTL